MNHIDRRKFLQLTGMAAITSSLNTNIAKALAIPANNRTGSIRDVEHIVILMQENRPFDHHFGTLRGVRGFSDPRAVDIHLPLQGGGTAPASVFLQPAGAANIAAGFAVPPGNFGGPANGVEVIPPFRVNPESVSPGLKSLGLTYLPGTGHSWAGIHAAWNQGQYDNWPAHQGPIAMNYMTRDDIPYHCALADAFTVGDAYFCSVMAPTNPNRDYLFSGCIGNVNYLGSGGTDGHGAGPVTYNGLSVNNAYFVWETLPEVLQAAGVSWKFYQDLAGTTFAPDFGDGTGNSFAGNFGDTTVLYFNQYATAPMNSPLFQNAATGTGIINIIPGAGAPESDWLAWAEHLFDQFRSDVQNGTLPQVSWIVAPAGYTEHSDWPSNYGAWYISQIFDILVSNPEVFSKTVPSSTTTRPMAASITSCRRQCRRHPLTGRRRSASKTKSSRPRYPTARSASPSVCRSSRSRPGAREVTSIPRSSITRRWFSSSRSVSESLSAISLRGAAPWPAT